MAVYITKEERVALLDASDFISHHSDAAIDHEPFEKMQTHLMDIFRKAKADSEKSRLKRLVRHYLKEARKLPAKP